MQNDWEVWDSLDGIEDIVQFEESKGHKIIVSVTLMIKILEHADFLLYCHFVEEVSVDLSLKCE